LPLGSVKRRSTQSISSSLRRERMVPALFAMCVVSLCSMIVCARTNARAPAARRTRTRRFELGSSDSPAEPPSQEGGEYFTGVVVSWAGSASIRPMGRPSC
jgi:hypothetical protein